MRILQQKSSLFSAGVLGLVLLLPLVILEMVNRWKFQEGFPFAVFAFTWVLQTAFIWAITPIIKTHQSGKSLTKKPFTLFLRIVGLMLLAYIWGAWIMDQWPCLMGVPNCD